MLRAVLAFAWTLWLMHEAGGIVRRFSCTRDRGGIWIRSSMGMGVFSLGVFALGAVHLFTLPVVVTIMLVLSLIFLRKHLKERVQGPVWSNLPRLSVGEWMLLLCCAIPSLVGLGAALAPEVRGDSVIYHISASLLFVVNRGHVEIPSSALTYIPQNQQLLYALGLLLGNDSTARLFHWLAGVLLLIGIGHVARALGCSRSGALASSALLALFPTWIYLASATMIDLAVANYVLAAVFAVLFCGADHAGSPERRTVSQMALAGIFAGLAMGCKYTAMVVGLFPLCLLVLTGGGWIARLRHTVVLGSVAFVIFSPWLVRNWIWTGNPVAPSFMGRLGPPGVPYSTIMWPDIQAGRPGLFLQPMELMREYWTMLLAFGNFGYNMPFVSLFIGGAALLAAGKDAFPRPVMLLVVFALISFVVGVPFGVVRSDSRYIMAHVGILAILTVFWFESILRVYPSRKTMLQIIAALSFTLLLLFWTGTTRSRFRDLRETVVPIWSEWKRHAYSSRRLPWYAQNQALNRARIASDGKVLGAHYPARVNYVLSGAPLRPEFFEHDPGKIVSISQLRALERAGVRYLFGEANPAIAGELEQLGVYGGLPLYRIRK